MLRFSNSFLCSAFFSFKIASICFFSFISISALSLLKYSEARSDSSEVEESSLYSLSFESLVQIRDLAESSARSISSVSELTELFPRSSVFKREALMISSSSQDRDSCFAFSLYMFSICTAFCRRMSRATSIQSSSQLNTD